MEIRDIQQTHTHTHSYTKRTYITVRAFFDGRCAQRIFRQPTKNEQILKQKQKQQHLKRRRRRNAILAKAKNQPFSLSFSISNSLSRYKLYTEATQKCFARKSSKKRQTNLSNNSHTLSLSLFLALLLLSTLNQIKLTNGRTRKNSQQLFKHTRNTQKTSLT